MESLPRLQAERRALQTKLQRLQALSYTPEVAEERTKVSDSLRECDSKILIRNATRWGIDVTRNPEWFAHEAGGQRIITSYLNETATAVIEHRIRKSRLTYWKGWAQILIPILSLLIAIIALLKR